MLTATGTLFPLFFTNRADTIRYGRGGGGYRTRDIQRLPTTPFSLVLRKEYLTVHRETLTQYITFKRGGERGVCTRIRLLIRIWILQSLNKNSKKTLDFCCFLTFFYLFFYFLPFSKNDVIVPSKSNMQKNFFSFLLASWRSLMKIRMIRIRIRIRIH